RLFFAFSDLMSEQLTNLRLVPHRGQRGIFSHAVMFGIGEVVESQVEGPGQQLGGALRVALGLGRLGGAGGQAPDAGGGVTHASAVPGGLPGAPPARRPRQRVLTTGRVDAGADKEWECRAGRDTGRPITVFQSLVILSPVAPMLCPPKIRPFRIRCR